MTIHSTAEASGPDLEALALLRELVHLDELEFIDTTAGSQRTVVAIEERNEELGTSCSFALHDQSGRTFETNAGPYDWWMEAARARGTTVLDANAWMQDLHAAGAHHSYEYDLLITTSADLLRLRDEPEFRTENILSPLDAIKLVGLFLRSRNCFVYRAWDRGKVSIDSWSFYLLLTRMKLPRLWDTVGNWNSDPLRTSEVSSLRASVISRCRRAIEARDAIGCQFYLRHDNRTADNTLYHLDYLLLLLSGALDALMLVVKRTHNINIDDRKVGFWSREFRKKLSSAAPAFLNLMVGYRAEALRELLAAPRNSIHSIQLQSMAFQEADRPAIGVVRLGQHNGLAAMEAAKKLGGADKWGLLVYPGFPAEPYCYSGALTETCFELIQDLFEVIEERLFAGQPAVAEPAGWFTPDRRRRVGLLG